MNDARRKELKKAVSLIDDAKEKLLEARGIVDIARDEEQDAYDNLPESLQESEKGEAINDNIDRLDEAVYELESVDDTLDEQIGAINETIGE